MNLLFNSTSYRIPPDMEKGTDVEAIDYFNSGGVVVVEHPSGKIKVVLQRTNEGVRSAVCNTGDLSPDEAKAFIAGQGGVNQIVMEALEAVGVAREKIEPGSGTLRASNTAREDTLKNFDWGKTNS